MELIRNFTNLTKNDAPIAGGKGASLGEMTQAGIPVPPGFVVLSDSFEQFIKETDLVQEIEAILHKVDHKQIHTVEAASEEIRALILSREMPGDIATEVMKHFTQLKCQYVAVRSSATAEDGMDHAWAGQLESYLNTTEDQILTKVKLCWSSLFTPRAIFYRFEKGLNLTKISVAVVVQKMVESEVSGIAFSVHPVTEDYNQLIIEAGFGLGEAIVSGSVTPDSYVVEKEPRNILDINVSTQERALYRSEHNSAEHGNNEWRNIPEPKASSQVLTKEQILELSEIILKIENHYGFPCDIEWAYEAGKFYIVQSRPITTLSKKTSPTPNNHSFGFKDKSQYFTLGQWVSPVLELEAWLDWSKTEDAKSLELDSNDPAIVLDGNYFFPIKGTYTTLKEKINKEFVSGNFDITTKILDLAKKLSHECIAMANRVGPNPTFDDFSKAFDLMSRLRFPWMSCFPIGDGGEEAVKRYSIEHSLTMDKVTDMIPQLTNSVNDDQKELSKFKIHIEKEGLSFDIEKIESKNSSLAKKIKEYQKKTEYIGTHHFWGDERNMDRLMEAIKNASPESENKKEGKSKIEAFNIVAEATKLRLECAQSSAYLAYTFRPFMTNLAKQYGITYDDLIYLTTSEIKNLIDSKKEIIPSIKERQESVGVLKVDKDIVIVVGKELEELERHFGLLDKLESVEQFTGAIGNKGIVRGTVVVVFKPTDQVKVQPGMILVAPETTPDFIPSMGKAAAFVTDQGGITSHAAIVAREMGKPCITGTKIATKILKDGDIVEVDADKGTVRIIK